MRSICGGGQLPGRVSWQETPALYHVVRGSMRLHRIDDSTPAGLRVDARAHLFQGGHFGV